MSRKLTTEEFIQKAIQKHGTYYDYSKTQYAGKASRVIITCPVHGEFEQIASDHTNGSCCPRCAKVTVGHKKKLDFSTLVERANLKHGGKYTYHPETYVNTRTKMRITCPEHGDFYQTPSAHCTTGQGCPECKRGGRYSTESFITKMEQSGSKYDYSKTIYFHSSDKITVTCIKHGDFHPIAFQHGYGIGCPSCASIGPSAPQLELCEILDGEYTIGDRSIIKPKELDIVHHASRVAIEFNGTYWHSLDKKTHGYHKEKRKLAEKAGYRLISVSEQDWKDKRNIIEKIIKSAIGIANAEKVNARACEIVDLTPKESREFLNEFHIQGNANAKYKFGLTDKGGNLVAVMTFRELEPGVYDMVRYATSCNVRGGQSKLFKHAVKTLGMEACQSFVDCDYFTGSSYENSGFHLVDDSTISFRVWHRKVGFMSREQWWKVNIKTTLSKLGLPEEIYDDTKTQREMMREAGCLVVENSGTKKYMWKKGA